MRIVDLDASSAPERITVLSYGAMRSGKSRFSATFPRPLFLADATETGWTTIKNMDPQVWFEPGRRPEVWAIEKAPDMMAAISQIESDLKVNPQKWHTVVVDSLTFYSDLFFNAIFQAAASGGRTPDLRQLYGQLGNHLRDLRIRLHSLPLNVVWLALEKSPGDENPFGGPMLSGQASQKFCAGVDYIFYHRSFQVNPQIGPQWELHTRQWGPYKAGGRDEGLLPDPLPECAYRALMEPLGLVDPTLLRQPLKQQALPGVSATPPLPGNGSTPAVGGGVTRRIVAAKPATR